MDSCIASRFSSVSGTSAFSRHSSSRISRRSCSAAPLVSSRFSTPATLAASAWLTCST
jgi:hypothetical protein